MREACFCGRVGEVEDREPVSLENDLVIWLLAEARTDVFEEAAKKYAHRLSPTAA